jgi:formyl-CoA transferase
MIVAPAELPHDAHAVAVGLFETYDHQVVGRVRHPRHPTRFGATPAVLTRASPALGEHTDEILAELGFGPRTAELRAAGVVT